jgi:hypothetical protein
VAPLKRKRRLDSLILIKIILSLSADVFRGPGSKHLEEWKKMKDELDHINRKSLKTKDMKTIETAEKLEDLENTSSRALMFTAIKDLFAFSMRALNLCKTIADTKDHKFCPTGFLQL